MDPSFIEKTHAVGKKLYVWTADDPITIFKMLTYGADGIITNEPEIAKKVIEERKNLETYRTPYLACYGTFRKRVTDKERIEMSHRK